MDPYACHRTVRYVRHLIQQKSKPYLKHVRSVNLAEQIGMASVEFQENGFFFYRIVVSSYYTLSNPTKAILVCTTCRVKCLAESFWSLTSSQAPPRWGQVGGVQQSWPYPRPGGRSSRTLVLLAILGSQRVSGPCLMVGTTVLRSGLLTLP